MWFLTPSHVSCVTAGVPFLITAELFKQSHRPTAYTVAGCLNWLSNFTIGFVFPFLEVRGKLPLPFSSLVVTGMLMLPHKIQDLI